jgi:integrase
VCIRGAFSWPIVALSLGRTDEVALADARTAAQTLRAQAALGQLAPVDADLSDMTLGTFLTEKYEPWMRATYTARTRQVDRVRAMFADFLETPLVRITAGMVDRWRSDRRDRRRNKNGGGERRVSGSTVNRDLAALQAALSRAVDWGFLTINPLTRMKRAVEDESAVVRYLSDEEEADLRATLVARDQGRRRARDAANRWRRDRGYDLRPAYGVYTDHLTPLVLLALNTGLRRGELFRLQWQDVQFKRRLLTVRGGGAKSGQTRHVPLNSEAAKVLERWKQENGGSRTFVFMNARSTEPLNDVKKAWAVLVKKAGLLAFRFHDLRHTFASKLVMAGVDLNTVRELLGHSDIAMTLRYAHLAPEHKAAAVEKLVLDSNNARP